ncbi:MAG: cytochrome-c oxidase, cbb3-type subunit II [Alphaproteobacteria bacterium]|nr:cytochrome-c oxidase, cbb3-type subunit II [Alphaproteobacteria bacterium]MBF0130437.1 cytochrome-c oxidase, cbb3-type subunit II [Alphaproteobacteria bacterium]
MIKHHKIFETNVLVLILGIFVTIIVGGLVEVVPLFTIESTIEKVQGVRPYSPLEQVGRNVYVREGCYLCHSQMIRPFRDEVERYGHYSLAAESQYDHPFQWGSKRTGPDLARVGGKFSSEWHAAHLVNPRAVVPESIMPGYPHLAKAEVGHADIAEHLKALRMVGVPYTEDDIKNALADMKAQATPGAETKDMLARYPKAHVGDFDGDPARITEADALIAYLQVLGTMVDFTSFDPRSIER